MMPSDTSQKAALVFDDQLLRPTANGLLGSEPFALFLRSVGSRFQSVTYLGRLAGTQHGPGYGLSDGAQLLSLPGYPDVPSLCLRFPVYLPQVMLQLRTGVQRADVLFLHWPHPISLLAIAFARASGRRLPICLFARTNARASAAARYKGWRKLLAIRLVALLEFGMRLLRRDVIVFAAGAEIHDLYRKQIPRTHRMDPVYLTRDSRINEPPAPARRKRDLLRLLYTGRLEPEKGVAFLVEAVGLLHRRGVAIQLDVAGSGQEETSLKAQAGTLGISGLIDFHGHVAYGEKLFELHRAADLMIVPSLTEGLPHVLLEAMALGTPVIATRVGGIPGVIRHGDNGWLVDAGSAEALAGQIQQLACAPDIRAAAAVSALRESNARQPAEAVEVIVSALKSWDVECTS